MSIMVVLPSDSSGEPAVVGDTQVYAILNNDGPAGVDAISSLGVSVSGPFDARQAVLPAPVMLPTAGAFTASTSLARAFIPCTGQNVWSVTKNGTFASELQATDAEVAAVLFATITFPAGPGLATWNYPNGGSFEGGDVLRVWESDAPDATQANTSLTFAGD